MAKVFLVISILLLIGAAGLGFVAKGKAEQKVAELRMISGKFNEAEQQRKVSDGKAKAATEELAAITKTIDEQKTQITDLGEKATKATEEAKKADDAVKEKEVLLVAVTEERDKLKATMANTPNSTGEPGPATAALQAQLAEAQKALAEAKVAKDEFQNRQKAAEENLVAAQNRIKHYEAPVANAGLTGRVVAVNNGWNFVVIDVGDKQGVTVNSPLLVVRGGQRVANLKITSVEPRTSIADVIPGTMARGTVVQPGDRVVFAGTRGQPPPAPLGPAGTPAGVEVPPAPAPGLPQ